MLRFIFYVNIFKAIILSAVSQHGSGGGGGGFAVEHVQRQPGLDDAKTKRGYLCVWPPQSHSCPSLLASMEADDGFRSSATSLRHSSAVWQLSSLRHLFGLKL